MEYESDREPFPRWFPMFLVGMGITSLVIAQVLA
jgi:hypothetical protein